MIKENQKTFNDLNVVSDGLILLVSMMLAYYIRFHFFTGASGHLSLEYFLTLCIIALPLYLLIYSGCGLYESFRQTRFLKEFRLIIRANIIGFFLLLALLFVFKQMYFSRWTLVFFCCFNTFGTSCKRYSLRKILKQYRKKGYNIKHVVVVGSGPLAKEYINTVNNNKYLGFSIRGYIADKPFLPDFEPKGVMKRLGEYKHTYDILDELNPDEVVVALEGNEFQMLPKIINSCEKSGTKLNVIPFYTKYLPANPYMDEIEGIPLINIRRIPLDNFLNSLAKRTMDIIGSLVLIILTLPVMLFAAIGTKLSSPGPVIFKQERVGLGKKPFTMYKFRSMRVNVSSDTGWTTDTDPRKTKFGSFIRKFSIDELPQFFNVLKGDMSLVGPRPELPYFVDQFKETIPLYMVKHQVRPGITGWAQVHGYRGDTSIKKRIEHDIYYIENWTLMLDIKILFMTAFGGIINSEKL